MSCDVGEVTERLENELHIEHFTNLFLSSFSKGPQKRLQFLLKTSFAILPLLSSAAVQITTDIAHLEFEAVHIFDGFIFNSHVYLLNRL